MARVLLCLLSALSTACLISAATEFKSDSVVSLTDTDFVEATSDGKLWFVKFFTPWCGHCKKLAPAWSALGEKFKSNENVKIAHVDCTQHKSTCSAQEIKGYPTLKAFFEGKEQVKYSGGRDIESLAKFVEDKHGELFVETAT